MHRYFIAYKPFQVLSQFSPEAGKKTLKDFFPVPQDVYPVGRLDHDSEGLLILTNDKSVNHQLLHPSANHEKEYWVQVDGEITEEALLQLQKGVMIHVNGKSIKTLPAFAKKIIPAPEVPERNPPIRFRKDIPTSWVSITITEGKNRQVRKMTAAVGFPTLRLIRVRIQDILLNDMQPGEIKELKAPEFFSKCRLGR